MLKVPGTKITKRGVLYVGFPCNLRCKFCYYTNKEKAWHPLDQCKDDANLFRQRYRNKFVDITGGEPTIYPHIHPLVTHCREIGLKPTIITNVQVLADKEVSARFKKSGTEDFLCSIHALRAKYDDIVGKNGSFQRLEKGVDNLNELQIPFRVNCVLTRASMPDLTAISEFCHSKGCKVINFISYNPYLAGRDRADQDFQAKHSEITPHLTKALEYCDEVKIEANVRYFPFCMMKDHEEKCYNWPQLPYDPGEWDFQSWHSDRRHHSAPADRINDSFYHRFQDAPAAYFEVAKRERGYHYCLAPKCHRCMIYSTVCDGLTHQYFGRFGDKELLPYLGQRIRDPRYFIHGRDKYLHRKKKEILDAEAERIPQIKRIDAKTFDEVSK